MTTYKDIFSNHINDIIELVKNNKIKGENEAVDKFKLYLETIQEIGPFNIENWRQDWRKKVWKFGEEFKKSNPSDFLLIINELLNKSETKNKEVLEFIRSEIIVNYLPDNECKKHLEILIQTYPLNPEFRNTLGHYFTREKQLIEAITQYKLAFKIDPKNQSFLNNCFTRDQNRLNDFLDKAEYEEGKKYLKTLYEDIDYIGAGSNIKSTFNDFDRRFNDHLHFQKKLQSLEKEFQKRINSELDAERKRIVEILGFFSAIVAFILSTVSIGKNFSFIEAIYFIVALGLILILFNVSLSVLFSSSKTDLLKDKKFWILIFSLLLIFLFIIMSSSISPSDPKCSLKNENSIKNRERRSLPTSQRFQKATKADHK